MAKTITLNYKGVNYTLEYTRRSVDQIEKAGFDIQAIDRMPRTSIMLLVRGAFLAHNRAMPAELVEEIYDHIPQKEKFISMLTDMYTEHIEALTAEPEGDEGNASWETSW